jgi:hypothetical protein
MSHFYLNIYLLPSSNLSTSKSILSAPSPPQYRNAVLEEQITKNKNSSSLSLIHMRLSIEDMEIVAYYALRNNNVSVLSSYFLLIDLEKFVYHF